MPAWPAATHRAVRAPWGIQVCGSRAPGPALDDSLPAQGEGPGEPAKSWRTTPEGQGLPWEGSPGCWAKRGAPPRQFPGTDPLPALCVDKLLELHRVPAGFALAAHTLGRLQKSPY